MTTYDIIQRVELGHGPVPMLRRVEGGMESLVYQGRECVSLEQAFTLSVSAFKNQLAPAKKPKAEDEIEMGRGLPRKPGD